MEPRLTTSPRDLSVLLLMTNTLAAERWSGIHRVAVELARNLGRCARLDIVKWDDQDGQLRFADRADLDRLFGHGGWPVTVRLRPTAHKVRYRFGDELDTNAPCWLLDPEIGYHAEDGNEALARILTQCREYGVRTAAVFYDLIPVTNAAYREYASRHVDYSCELFRTEVILPISAHSADELARFYDTAGPLAAGPQIIPVLLPELQAEERARPPAADAHGLDTVMLVGTVEPRKQQVEFLRAFVAAARRSPAVAALKVFVAGSLHPDVAVEFRRLMGELWGSVYADYAPEALIREHYPRALFSAFASNDEGYGLPIAESLAQGVPCLCASFGSMAEIAQGGGCLTVDVDDPSRLEDAIVALAEDGSLRARLAEEIGRRPFRDWGDYAAELVSHLASQSTPAESPVDVQVVTPDALATADPQSLDRWARADVLAFTAKSARDAFIETADARRLEGLLPTRMVVGAPAGLAETAGEAVRTLGARRARSRAVAELERAYRQVKAYYQPRAEARPCFLRIILSTYNRAPFVQENARWLLEKVARPGSGIEVVVIDNASTDDSLNRLVEFVGNANYRLIRNTANTGMLGNLKVCSTLAGADHVWVIGDDDYIVAEEVPAVVRALRQNPGLPLAFVNFGVYHRFALSPGDTAKSLIAEQTALAPQAVPSGLVRLTEAAAQHDNLFTAIYPIIWRSDVLAACFNYPFTGTPFGDLVESVPTTKILLDTYGDTEVYWHKPIGVVGNAHNSWSRHRPRWHGLLMPEVFELARTAGVDPKKLYTWSRVHYDLFAEAVGIAEQNGWSVSLEDEELDTGWRVFRRRLEPIRDQRA